MQRVRKQSSDCVPATPTRSRKGAKRYVRRPRPLLIYSRGAKASRGKVGSCGKSDGTRTISPKEPARNLDKKRGYPPCDGSASGAAKGGRASEEWPHLMHRRIEGVATITTRLNENEKRIPRCTGGSRYDTSLHMLPNYRWMTQSKLAK